MIKPKCWKLCDYLQSIYEWTQGNENKNPIFYYFPITQLDIGNQMELVKWAFEKSIPVVNLLWMMLENKKKQNYGNEK